MPFPSWTATQLRRDLNARAEAYARNHHLQHDFCPGPSPTILFGPGESIPGQPIHHGNFHPAAYAAICANSEWLRRLTKAHTASRRSRARHDWRWMELDSASSSDALLMNVFCHPGVFDGRLLSAPVAAILNVDRKVEPRFGARPGVPLREPLRPRRKNAPAIDRLDRLDRTEVDLTLTGTSGSLHLEAKLTESDFQTAAPSLVERYRDLEAVFDTNRLSKKPLNRIPRTFLIPPPLRAWMHHPGAAWLESNQTPDADFPDDAFLNLPSRSRVPRIAGYQLIRNVLAAFASGASFCVLCDAHRHDLIESWFSVLSAVHAPDFTHRLKLLTWQELAGVLPSNLQHFLDEKYGIVP